MFQAPAKQSAANTISTLSNRLSTATLLEDRRAAIHGLRSFAKDYPASVASGSLRSLISCLANDVEDVDTVKPVLETLIGLFKPSPQSPEASEDIAFWLADEFTQHQDNIKILLDLLETHDFYSRLYSIQLVTCIFESRPERTQECVLNAALGTSRLVAMLDDGREPIRNAGLVLLGDLTQSSTELQKLVAFENTFDRIFNLIQEEGSLTQGTVVVQDSLDLLANLVQHNPSNQSLFRETGCVSKLAALLHDVHSPTTAEGDEEHWPSPHRDKNIWGFLAIIRLFLAEGGIGVQENQVAFSKHGLLQQVLELAFSGSTDTSIKAEALYTCADMIKSNAAIQQGFAVLLVSPAVNSAKPPQQNGTINGVHKTHVIEALLDLSIAAPPGTTFESRMAACECIKAYFRHHREIRHHFLNRAIDLHLSREDETSNVLTTLLRDDGRNRGPSDPYPVWFAADIVFHLIWEDSEAKAMLMKVSEGDAENGEEVITCIQRVAENLIASAQKEEDERILIGYFTVLSGWLFEDAAAVNDFLGEGSNVQTLKQIMTTAGDEHGVVKGLCAVLLGIIYEYSTKDSPVPRRKLQPIMTAQLGREKYLQALRELRQHPLIRDFEVVPQGAASHTPGRELPPYAFFDATFVDFLKDNFSRLSRAIDRDPGIEAQIPSREEGIDRDLVDSLRAQLENKTQGLQNAEGELLDLERRLEHEQASHRKEHETTAAEINRIKQINEALHKNHEAAIEELERSHTQSYQELETTTAQQAQSLQKRLDEVVKTHAEESARTKEYYERTINQLRNAKTGLENRLAEAVRKVESSDEGLSEAQQSEAQAKNELRAAKEKIEQLEHGLTERFQQVGELRAVETQLKEALEDEKTKVSMLEKEVSDLQVEVEKREEKVKVAERAVVEKEEARAAVQTELDDMLMVFSDLEEKRASDKKRLKALGEEISDGEDEDEGEGDDEEDEEDVE
ncbi:hypothetical protein EJ08DRAFT_729621 [Tothia fuscella]|uniref:Uncharacterized protein n=1 Tax=Tothia fuscella TaxID=1048955 RepID=A0A9P4P051_9PEZI|nr:hypothetical protein EJ08DRAFT_729621 [Tothia fuscella]